MADDWWKRANCRDLDTNLFFGDGTRGGQHLSEAREVCRGCEVREPCLEYALSLPLNPPGVWGGLAERPRKLLRQQRNAARKKAG